MALRLKPLLGMALAALIMLACVAPAAAEEPVLFVDELLPPFTLGEVGKTATGGISYDMLKEVFRRMGMEVRLDLMPWARAMKMAEYGRADGLPLLLPKEERKRFLVFTDPIVEGGDAVIYNKSLSPDFKWTGYDCLDGLSVGMVRGYSFNEDLLSEIKARAARIEYSVDVEANFRKLHAGRMDLVVEDSQTAKTAIHEHPEWLPALKISDKLLNSYFWHMGISRKSKLADKLPEINRVLDEMRKDGALARITRVDG